MIALRRLLLNHRALSAWVIAFALLMKLLVPAGFMPVVAGGTISIEICSGTAPAKMMMAMPGMAHHQDKSGHHGKEMPCAFSGLTAPSLAAADPLLPTLAIAIIVATVFGVATPSVARAPAYLRPPLRGPPARA